jgi:hypothetical protein
MAYRRPMPTFGLTAESLFSFENSRDSYCAHAGNGDGFRTKGAQSVGCRVAAVSRISSIASGLLIHCILLRHFGTFYI